MEESLCVGRWLNGSFTVKRQNADSGPTGEKREMHMETESQESKSIPGLTAVGETLTPELRFLWRKTSFPTIPDFLPCTFILARRRNKWLVGKLESTKHVLLSSFLYDICVLTRNTRLSNPTLSVHQYLTDYNAKLHVKNCLKLMVLNNICNCWILIGPSVKWKLICLKSYFKDKNVALNAVSVFN